MSSQSYFAQALKMEAFVDSDGDDDAPPSNPQEASTGVPAPPELPPLDDAALEAIGRQQAARVQEAWIVSLSHCILAM